MRRPVRAGALWLAIAGLALAAAAPAEEEGEIHEVRPGETLSHIALYGLGDPALWPAIYAANRDQIKDPALIYPGQRLAIPELDPARRAALLRDARNRSTR